MGRKIGVSLKIDVSKIEKARLFKGQKGTYLDATAFIDLDELDQYDNSGMITQDVSKEEKQAGTKGPILGNSKVFWKDEGGQDRQQEYYERAQTKGKPVAGGSNLEPVDDYLDDIPF